MNQNYQSGRSMVEMLGVLAIIGILSIGGVTGYSYAMDKHCANQIIKDVNLRAVDLIAQTNRKGPLSLSEWPTKTGDDCDIGLDVDTENNTISGGIFVKDVSKDVCEIIADDLLPENVKLVIDGENYVAGKCGETNKMVFYYDEVVAGGNNSAGGNTGGGNTSGDNTGGENTGTEDTGDVCNGIMSGDVCTPCPSNTTVSSDKTECVCSNGGPYDFDTNSCLSSCEEAFYNAFQIGEMRGDLVTADGSSVTFDVSPDGTETTVVGINNVSAGHCKLKVASGQNIVLDLNGYVMGISGMSIAGTLIVQDNSDTNMDGTGSAGIYTQKVNLSGATLVMNSGILNGKMDVKDSVVNINGGMVMGDISQSGSANLIVNGGKISGNLTQSGSGRVNINGGIVQGGVEGNGSVELTMSGGTIEGTYIALSDSVMADISGGIIDTNTITLSDNVSMGISGGEITANTLSCSGNSGLTLSFVELNVQNMSCENVEDYRDF